MRLSLAGIARCLMLATALGVSAAAARAAPNSAELDARYTSGDFLEAASMAEAVATPDDLAFAARAILAYCFTRESDPDQALVDRARRNAETALNIDPAHTESRLQLAIALALKSRDMSAMDAWASGYGDRGKKLAREVLKADPSNYYAHGFLAVWNVEVRRRAGSIGSGFMGASVSDGRKHYAEAIRLAPDDVGVHWQYARALAALDARKYAGEIRDALAMAVAASAGDRVEQVMQARAVALSIAMQGDTKQAQALAQDLM